MKRLILSFNKKAKYISPSQNNYINRTFYLLQQLATWYIHYSFTMSPIFDYFDPPANLTCGQLN